MSALAARLTLLSALVVACEQPPQHAVARHAYRFDATVRVDAAVAPRCDPAPVCPRARPAVASIEGTPQWRRIRAIVAEPPERIDVAEVSALVSQADDATVDVAATLRRLDAMADEVRRATPARCEGACRLRVLTRHVFEVWRFRAVGDPNELYNDPDEDLIDRVLARRHGYCEGLTLLYLALGRRLGIPLSGVLARQHIYVRYTGPDGPIDVDATREGAPPRPEREPARCAGSRLFGRSLDAREMAAQVVSVVGIMDTLPARSAWLDAAITLAPDDPDLRNNRGVERERWYDLDGALADYRAAVAIDPCASFYRANVAEVLRRMGRVAEASAELDELDARAARGDTDDDALSRTLARADLALDRGDDADASRLYARALSLSHRAPLAWEALGIARVVQGDARGGAEALLAALESDPRAETRLWMVEALLDAGEPTVGVELDRAARDGAPEEDVSYWRAAVALARGRHREARERAVACIARGGVRCARALVILGDAARAEGDEVCARAYWEAFLGCPYPPRDRYGRRLDARVRARLSAGDAGAR
ncbi:MAG: transglutaminase family protein [Polyangiales bacterium]